MSVPVLLRNFIDTLAVLIGSEPTDSLQVINDSLNGKMEIHTNNPATDSMTHVHLSFNEDTQKVDMAITLSAADGNLYKVANTSIDVDQLVTTYQTSVQNLILMRVHYPSPIVEEAAQIFEGITALLSIIARDNPQFMTAHLTLPIDVMVALTEAEKCVSTMVQVYTTPFIVAAETLNRNDGVLNMTPSTTEPLVLVNDRPALIPIQSQFDMKNPVNVACVSVYEMYNSLYNQYVNLHNMLRVDGIINHQVLMRAIVEQWSETYFQ